MPIFHILHKFDGATVTDDIRAGRRRFRITRLPRYLALHYRRFTKNNFFIEKNPTLVNFPVKVGSFGRFSWVWAGGISGPARRTKHTAQLRTPRISAYNA